MTRAYITGVGAHAPKRVVSNADLERIVETSDEWIVQRSGIRERHIAEEGESTCDLALPAAQQALDRGDRVLGCFGGGERTASLAQERTSCLGEFDAAGVADEQRGTQLTLERADRGRQAGLRDRHRLGGPREVLLLGHRDEVFQVPQLHDSEP